jgi:hypothetical protein
MAAPQAFLLSHEEHEGSEEHEVATHERREALVSFASFVIFV